MTIIKISCIYRIRNLINNKFYIGSTKCFETRKTSHLKNLRRNVHHSIYLQRSFDKYGKDNFVFEIVEVVEKIANLFIREQHYIDTIKPHYNISTIAQGSNGRLGMKNTKEHNEKTRKARLGSKASKETREKQSRTRMGKEPWNKGTRGMGIMKAWNKGKKLSTKHGQNCTRRAHELLRKKVFVYDLQNKTILKFNSLSECNAFLKVRIIGYYLNNFKVFRNAYIILLNELDWEQVIKKAIYIKGGNFHRVQVCENDGSIKEFNSVSSGAKHYKIADNSIHNNINGKSEKTRVGVWKKI